MLSDYCNSESQGESLVGPDSSEKHLQNFITKVSSSVIAYSQVGQPRGPEVSLDSFLGERFHKNMVT